MIDKKLARGYAKTQWETTKHKGLVAWFMLRLWDDSPGLVRVTGGRWRWFWRALKHDWSKYRWDEAGGFAKTIFDLGRTDYGTPKYKRLLREIKPSIERHYARHDHHPEHYKDAALRDLGWDESDRTHADPPDHVVMRSGVPYAMMSPMARMEMLCDWAAAVRRMKDKGDLRKSIEVFNSERFGYGAAEIRLLTDLAQRIGQL